MKAPPSVDAFVNGASESPVKAKPANPPPTRKERSRRRPTPPPTIASGLATPELRKNVVIALVLRDVEALKERAYAESKKTGRRVTQQSIVDAALRAYLYS